MPTGDHCAYQVTTAGSFPTKWLQACVFLAAMALIACGSGSTTSPSGTGSSGSSSSGSSSSGSGSSSSSSPHGTFQATIDGVPYTAATISAKKESNGDLNISTVDAAVTTSLGFIAASNTPQQNPVAAGGAYGIGSTTSNALLGVYVNGMLRDTFQALGSTGSGSIKVNAISSAGASGTFAFVVKSSSATKNVTNGTFDVTF